MFEIKHLKTLSTLSSSGNIRKAAEVLFSSQSALSHQLIDLEHRVSTPLFIRNTSPVVFTPAGQVLLNLAEDILPKIKQANDDLKSPLFAEKTLNVAIACHACFQWLLPITTDFSYNNQMIDVEFIDGTFDVSQYKKNETSQIDILFTDEKIDEDDLVYEEIGQFEVVAVLSKQQYAKQIKTLKPKQGDISAYLLPNDFQNFTLLTYPLPPEKLDIFTLFLTPADSKPNKVKQVNNSHVMLQMVAANMGIATLPDWLITSLTQQSLFHCLRLGEKGIHKKLYARYHKDSKKMKIIKQLIPEAIKAFSDLYTSQPAI